MIFANLLVYHDCVFVYRIIRYKDKELLQKKLENVNYLTAYTKQTQLLGAFDYSVIAVHCNNNFIFFQTIVHKSQEIIDLGQYFFKMPLYFTNFVRMVFKMQNDNLFLKIYTTDKTKFILLKDDKVKWFEKLK